MVLVTIVTGANLNQLITGGPHIVPFGGWVYIIAGTIWGYALHLSNSVSCSNLTRQKCGSNGFLWWIIPQIVTEITGVHFSSSKNKWRSNPTLFK